MARSQTRRNRKQQWPWPIAVRLPAEMIQKLDSLARETTRSRNGMIRVLLAQALATAATAQEREQ
jgi:metal-responsive CopG/Arc/MetJ family transcriptional regulator